MKCKYCHQPAGFLKSKHTECEQKHLDAIRQIESSFDDFFAEPFGDYNSLYQHNKNICDNGYISTDLFNSLLLDKIKGKIAESPVGKESFYMAFVNSLPEILRFKVQDDESYINYLTSCIYKELYALNCKDVVKDSTSNLINGVLCTSSSNQLHQAVVKTTIKAFDHRVNQILEDSIIDQEEEKSMYDFLQKTLLERDSSFSTHPSCQRFLQSLTLRDLQEGQKPNRCLFTNVPILLGKTEYIVWGFRNVVAYEEKTGRKYYSGSRGVSIKICKGVYYHVGGSKGHSVSYQYQDCLGNGSLIVTNKNIIFSGVKPVKIPINKVMSFTDYSDGIELVKEAANPKRYTFIGCDSWFIVNAIQLLVP